MLHSRRNLLQQVSSLGLLAVLAPFSATAQNTAVSSRIVLLGTQGGPNFNLSRGETANLLVVGTTPYLIDCGYGTLRALFQTDVSFLDIGQVFLTHLHDDHVADVVSLLGHQWTQGRVDPTTVHGPYGTDKLIEAALLYNQANTRIRMLDEARTLDPASVHKGIVLAATQAPALVFEDENVSVYSILNTHFPIETQGILPDRALAYRFNCPDRSVVFSGDTTYSENLVKLAQGADVLVCEAMDYASIRATFDRMVAGGNYADNPEGIWNHIIGTHATTEQAGRMAAEASVKTLVFNHILPGALDNTITDEIYIAGARKFFSGEIIVGKDQLAL